MRVVRSLLILWRVHKSSVVLLALALLAALGSMVAYTGSPQFCTLEQITGPNGPVTPCVASQQLHEAWGFGLALLAGTLVLVSLVVSAGVAFWRRRTSSVVEG